MSRLTDLAHRDAERRISEALASNATELDLSGLALDRLPASLTQLAALEQLNLSRCTQLTDLSFLAQLPALQQLNLWGCTQLGDGWEKIKGLSSLTHLDVWDAIQIPFDPSSNPLTSWPLLEYLICNRMRHVPNELGSENGGDNCIERISSWMADLDRGRIDQTDLKMFILGNGGVGKTQLCRRLSDDKFDTSVPTTHGINLGQFNLLEGDTEADPPEYPVNLNFWDFGGQDVYLGTHALFLDDRAIYVIAWHTDSNNTKEIEQNGVLMHNRPLRYWLEYVRSLAGNDAPIIVLQTQCDRESQVIDPQLPADHGFTRLRVTNSSAKNQRHGLALLQPQLESAAGYQIERHGNIPMPRSWVGVIDDLRQRRQNGQRTIPRAEFEQLCLERHGTSVPAVVLEYLQRSGRVFWREGAFEDQVVLDLAWAFEGVYAVFDRDKALPFIQEHHGRFKPELLHRWVWSKYAAEAPEPALFLSLMQQCGICFELGQGSNTYLAPALLPNEADAADQIEQDWADAVPAARAELHYTFLHEGILREVLCAIGKRAGHLATYWKYGVCFYDKQAKSRIKISSALPAADGSGSGNWIAIEATGSQALKIVTDLVDAILHINIGSAPDVRWPLKPAQAQPVARHANDMAELDPDAPLPDTPPKSAFDTLQPGLPPRAAGAAMPVYVSYKWGGESERLLNLLEQRRPPSSFDLRRDCREMRPGNWISDFEREIGRAQKVLVFLSHEYLQSLYCMQELMHLHGRALNDRQDFHDRVKVLVPQGMEFSDPFDRLDFLDFWQKRLDQLNARTARLKPGQIGSQTQLQIWLYEDICKKLDTILGWVADVLMPRGEAGVETVINLLLSQQHQEVPR